MVRVVALALTVVTGFSGLVYEVAWQKYLAVLLGSHSEATAAVLAIFLGALALGYALFGRVARRLVDRAFEQGRPARLLVTYGCVEMAIGVYAFAFPLAFSGVQALSLALPVADSFFAFGIDVALCALLIGPPAVLMGATVPLLTQGLSRGLEDATRLHALVYATNTAGAFVGALSAAFVLVPLALILIVSAYAPGHIRRWVRHPMLAGVMLWAGAHFLANGERAALILFGSFFAWSLVTFVSSWLRETPPPVVKGWGGDLTAIVLGALIALIIMNLHMYLFGVAIIG